MEKKLLELHKEWCETGMLHESGLCGSVPRKYKKSLELFEIHHDITEHYLKVIYWAYGGRSRSLDVVPREYSPLRQTIVCFLLAMEGEI